MNTFTYTLQQGAEGFIQAFSADNPKEGIGWQGHIAALNQARLSSAEKHKRKAPFLAFSTVERGSNLSLIFYAPITLLSPEKADAFYGDGHETDAENALLRTLLAPPQTEERSEVDISTLLDVALIFHINLRGIYRLHNDHLMVCRKEKGGKPKQMTELEPVVPFYKHPLVHWQEAKTY